jgi:hypothetical protein
MLSITANPSLTEGFMPACEDLDGSTTVIDTPIKYSKFFTQSENVFHQGHLLEMVVEIMARMPRSCLRQ